MATIKEQISANRQDAQRRFESVRQDNRLSDEGKRQALYQVYSKAIERHNAFVERHRAEEEQRLAKLHNELFSPCFTIGDADYQRPGIRSEFRKNLIEADKTLSEGGVEGLQRFLEMAELSGDKHAARAAFAVAHSRGYEPVVKSYLESHPDDRDLHEEYQALDKAQRNPDAIDMFARSFELAPPTRPPEIANYYPTDESPLTLAQSSDRDYRRVK